MRNILTALFLLGCRGEPEFAASDYVRADFGNWSDSDRDCQNTRQEVLIRDSTVKVTLSTDGCRVVTGRWVDPYDGSTTTDPSRVDVDHVLALEEAHSRGAAAWNRAKKREFYNNFGNLRAVGARSNRAKGSRGPAEWLPAKDVCPYLKQRLDVAQTWKLDVEPDQTIWRRECGMEK